MKCETTLIMKKETAKLQIFFDGRCYVCSKEIDIYRARNTPGLLEFIDIAHPDFSADEHGVDPKLVHKEFHVKDRDGALFTGVEAFIKIWEVLPGWEKAAKIGRIPPVTLVMKIGYFVFANTRPYLPRRKSTCSDGVCFR